MKRINILSAIAALLALTAFTGCDFENFGKDDNGEDITWLRLDLPKFDATYTFNLVDHSSGRSLETLLEVNTTYPKTDYRLPEQLLVTDGCLIPQGGTTSSGVYKLNLNPNIKLTGSNSVGFIVTASDSDYSPVDYISVPKVVKQSVPGHRNVTVDVVDLGAPPVSFSSGSLTVSGSYTRITPLTGKDNGNGYEYVGLYKATSNGAITVSANPGLFNDYGIYFFDSNMWNQPAKSVTGINGKYFFVVKKDANVAEGKLNLNITSPASNASITINYVVTTTSGQYKGAITGALPIKTSIEQIYVPASSTTAQITLTTTAPFKIDNPTRTINDIAVAGGANLDFNVTVDQQSDFTLFDLKASLFCRDDKAAALALTKDFQYSEGSTDMDDFARTWSSGQFVSGRASIFMKEDQMYTLRINIDNQWHKYNITTNPNLNIEDLNMESSGYIDSYKVYYDTAAKSWKISAEISADEFCNLNL